MDPVTQNLAPSTATAAPAAVAAPVTEDETKAAITSDFETFLSLLTAQLRNQDPSNPLDSTQFVAQLAQFSSVEQQVIGNEKLDRLVDVMGGGDVSALANWIGTEVQAASSVATSGGPVDTFFEVPTSSDYAVLRVFDEAGELVASKTLMPDTRNHTWDGIDLEGEDAGPGTYAFTLETFEEGNSAGMLPVEVFAPVREARIENGQTILVFDDGTRKPASDVTAVRGSS